MHYYQFNIGDYAIHTNHLDPIEDIAYRRMLDWCYTHEKPLPNDVGEIARLIRMRDHAVSVHAIITEFFEQVEGGWFSSRVQREIDHFRAKVEQASKAGKASAERRINARSTDVQPTNNHKPITNNQEPKNSNHEPVTKIKTATASRLPADWIPTVVDLEFLKAERPDLQASNVIDGFRDYWIAQPGAKGRKLDWAATWRNWIRNQRSGSAARFLTPQQQRDENNRRSTAEFLADDTPIFGAGSIIEGECSNA